MRITIHFDGGCKPNPGVMYGSYAICINGSEVCKETEDYGMGTSNVAEFSALYHALSRVFRILDSMNRTSNLCSLEIFTDSLIVRNRINRPLRKLRGKHAHSEGAKRMEHWTGRVMPLLSRFNHFTIEWNSRDVNVQKFGH